MKQRLRKTKSLFLHSSTSRQNKWRAKHYEFKLTLLRTVYISVRKFKTLPENRSKKFEQMVLQLNIFEIKEIAFRQKLASRRLTRNRFPKRLLGYSNTYMAIGLLGFVYFGLTIINASAISPPIVIAESVKNLSMDSDASVEEIIEPKYLDYSIPIELKIPSIGVNSKIITVGLLADGTVETSSSGHNVGWYEYSPTPGELGPSVLLGHAGTSSSPAVFWNLGKLSINDEIEITRQDGTIVIFRVDEVKQFSQDDFPTSQVYGNIDHAGLHLITCSGSFNSFSGRYSDNTIVFASAIE